MKLLPTIFCGAVVSLFQIHADISAKKNGPRTKDKKICLKQFEFASDIFCLYAGAFMPLRRNGVFT